MSKRKYKVGQPIKTPAELENQEFIYFITPNFKSKFPWLLNFKIVSVKWVKNMNYSVVMYRLRKRLIFKAIKVKK